MKGGKIMFKRIMRIFKSNANALLDTLEQPIKIMEQVIADSEQEIFKLYTSYEEIKKSIEDLDKLECDDQKTKDVVKSQKEHLEKVRDKLSNKIKEYREKIIKTKSEVKLQTQRNKAYDSILNIQKNLSRFNVDSDLSAITRMEEKISKKEAKIKAYEDMEGI